MIRKLLSWLFPRDVHKAVAATAHVSRPKRRVLFLDIDGVLHPHQRGTLVRIGLLEAVLRAYPEVDVVITSTWRMQHTREELAELFAEDVQAQIVGVTPFSEKTPYSRFNEVVEYMAGDPPLSWCALEDEAYLYPPDCQNVVLTDPAEGLTDADLAKVRAILQLA